MIILFLIIIYIIVLCIASVIKYGFQYDLYDLIRNQNESNKKILKTLKDFML